MGGKMGKSGDRSRRGPLESVPVGELRGKSRGAIARVGGLSRGDRQGESVKLAQRARTAGAALGC